jgi:hypothetical protein
MYHTEYINSTKTGIYPKAGRPRSRLLDVMDLNQIQEDVYSVVPQTVIIRK